MEGITTYRRTAFCDVLIVEDDVVLSDLLAGYLRRHGIDVRTAVSGADAFRLLETVAPRVGVFDYELPDITGLAFARSIHQQLPRMPIILMSASAQDVGQSDLKGTGIRLFVHKPVPPEALMRAVRQLIAQRR
jgi:two-component system, OmpR family, response regulator